MAENNAAALIYKRDLTSGGGTIELVIVAFSHSIFSIGLIPLPQWLADIQRARAMIRERDRVSGFLDALKCMRSAPKLIPAGSWLPKWEYFCDPWSPRQIYEFEADYVLCKGSMDIPFVLPTVVGAPTGGSLVFSLIFLLTYVRRDIPLEPDIPSPEEYAAPLLFPDGCRLYNPREERWSRTFLQIAYRDFNLERAGMIGEFFWVFDTDSFPAWHFIFQPYGTVVTPMSSWNGLYVTDFYDDWNTEGSAAGYNSEFLPVAGSGFSMYQASGYDYLASSVPGHWTADIPIILSPQGVPLKAAGEASGGSPGGLLPSSDGVHGGLDGGNHGINAGRIFASRMRGGCSLMVIGELPVEIGGDTLGG